MTAVVTSPTPYQLLPRLSNDEYEALKADVAENGIRVPIDVDEHGVILDGHHRAWIAADLNVECPRRVVEGLDDLGKRNYARAVNALRRHLTREARREQVGQMRSEGQSVRMIASTLGVPKSTVSDDLAQVSGSGHLTPAEPVAAPAPTVRVDTATGEVVDDPEPAPPTVSVTVTGLDGKTYRPAVSRKPPRKSLTDVAKTRGFALRQATDAVLRIFEDDRHRANEKQVADVLRGHLLYVAETVAAVLDQLP